MPYFFASLKVAVAAALIGTIVGLLAGYFGGWIDSALMRVADIALAIPFLPFVIVLTAFLRPSTTNIVIAVAILVCAILACSPPRSPRRSGSR